MAQSYTTPYFYTAALYALGAVSTFVLLRKIRPSADDGISPVQA